MAEYIIKQVKRKNSTTAVNKIIDNLDDILAMIDTGMTYAQIGEKYGFSAPTLSKVIQKKKMGPRTKITTLCDTAEPQGFTKFMRLMVAR